MFFLERETGRSVYPVEERPVPQSDVPAEETWPDVYQYATPISLPRGSTVTMEFTYDNSQANPRNPHHPPQHVAYGPRSTDEMGDLWLQLRTRTHATRTSAWPST